MKATKTEITEQASLDHIADVGKMVDDVIN